MSLAAFSILTSCSVKKNRAATRNYHAFVTRYNMLYNGMTRYHEAVDEMIATFVDNDSTVMLPHPADAKAGVNSTRFDYSIEKAQKAIALHSITSRPKGKSGHSRDPEYRKWMSRKEYNPTLSEAWLLLGNCYFMKGRFDEAFQVFTATESRFAHDSKTVETSRIMQARCRADMGRILEAGMILDRVDDKLIYNKKLKYLYYSTRSIIEAESGDNEKAAGSAMIGAEFAPDGVLASRLKQRAKMLFEKNLDVDTALLAVNCIDLPKSETNYPNDTVSTEPPIMHVVDKMPFTFDRAAVHEVVFSFDSDSINVNKLIYEIADFNFSTFDVEDFDINRFGENLSVGKFDNYEHAESYIKMFVRSNIQPVNKVRLTAISADDLEAMTSNAISVDDYLSARSKAWSTSENK